MIRLVAAALYGFAGLVFAADVVVRPVAPVAVGGTVVVAPRVSAPRANVSRPDYRSQAVLNLQHNLSPLQHLSPIGAEPFLHKVFENAESASVPMAPGRAPKAKPIRFKDLVIQRANFSEKTSISAILVDIIDRADHTLDIAIHGLSLPQVAQALLRAKERGVAIRILMNHSHAFPEREGQKRSPEIQFLIDNGFDMRTLRGGGPYGVMHHKFIVADKKLLKFGSYNWSKSADTKNYENVVFSDEKDKIAWYEDRFEKRWAEAKPAGEGALDAWPLEPTRPLDANTAKTIEFNGETFYTEMESPKGGVEEALLRAIRASKSHIDIAMFSLTSDPIVEALIAAKDRGVKVRLVVDRSQGVGRAMAADVKKLMEGGVAILWASGHQPGGVMHNKFAVFDRKMLEVGSFNWTNNAEHNNYENANFTLEPELVEDFLAEFEEIYNVGTTPTPKEAAVVEALIQAGYFDPFKPAESVRN